MGKVIYIKEYLDKKATKRFNSILSYLPLKQPTNEQIREEWFKYYEIWKK